MAEYTQPPGEPPGRPRAIRLTFAYKGQAVRLVSRQPVEMIVPPSEPLQRPRDQQGCWCELQDAAGQTLFRRVLHGAIRTDVEALSDAPGHPFTRRPVERPQGMFTVLVPDLAEAQDVALWNSPPGPEDVAAVARAAPVAREIARFPLRGGEKEAQP